MKIQIKKSADSIIGAVRVDTELFEKIVKIAKAQSVTNQEVVRAILKSVIDDVTY